MENYCFAKIMKDEQGNIINIKIVNDDKYSTLSLKKSQNNQKHLIIVEKDHQTQNKKVSFKEKDTKSSRTGIITFNENATPTRVILDIATYKNSTSKINGTIRITYELNTKGILKITFISRKGLKRTIKSMLITNTPKNLEDFDNLLLIIKNTILKDYALKITDESLTLSNIIDKLNILNNLSNIFNENETYLISTTLDGINKNSIYRLRK